MGRLAQFFGSGTARGLGLLALFGFGFYLGGIGPRADLDKLKTTTQAAATVQTVKNERVAERGREITATVGGEYAKGNSDVRRVHGPGRVRKPAGSGKAAPVSPPAVEPDGGPADPGSGSGEPAPQPDPCGPLKSDAAVTTRQLLFLQDWIRQQEDAWRAAQ